MSESVIVTEAARDLIARLKTRYGSLMFMQSGGCCDGSSPVCLSEGELLLGPGDLLIGEIAGCPFYIDREQYERWRKPQFLIDISPGEGDTFSLEGPEGLHFVARTVSKPETHQGGSPDWQSCCSSQAPLPRESSGPCDASVRITGVPVMDM